MIINILLIAGFTSVSSIKIESSSVILDGYIDPISTLKWSSTEFEHVYNHKSIIHGGFLYQLNYQFNLQGQNYEDYHIGILKYNIESGFLVDQKTLFFNYDNVEYDAKPVDIAVYNNTIYIVAKIGTMTSGVFLPYGYSLLKLDTNLNLKND
jgi:hypothetical protein